MSIKAKLSLFITIFVAITLVLNIWINYLSSKDALQASAEQQMNSIAGHIGVTLEASQDARQYLEDTIGEKLRIAAVAAQDQLSPDYNQITNEELVALTKKLGIDYITLWKQTADDIVVARASDQQELNMSSKSWDYWFQAFQQLFQYKEVSLAEGQKLPHYWAGPINFATSDPTLIKKWGYYYDGTTNYMINTAMNAQVFLDYEKAIGTEDLVGKLLKDNPNILEITGFDPKFFGKAPIIKMKKGVPVHNLDVRDIIFGQYTYKDSPNDQEQIQLALQSGTAVTGNSFTNDKRILKSFIPVLGAKPYVVSVTFDRETIRETLRHQLLVQSAISLGLILFMWGASYYIAGFMLRPLNLIVSKVNSMADGRFGIKIPIRSRDELGQLATQINTMASNLQSYLARLNESAEELRDTKEYLESFVNQTSDAIHVSDLDGLAIQVNQAFESLYGWSREEALGQRVPVVPAEWHNEFFSKLSLVLEGQAVSTFEMVLLTKDGKPLDISVTISPIRNGQGEVVAIASISRDITERKQTEEMLRRSEKLSLVGQLAAGVAHEIRNPLTTLRGFVQLQMKKGVSTPHQLEVMLSELDRINFIVSEFLVLAKPQVSRFVPVHLRDIIQDIVLLLDPQAHMSDVRIETRFASDLPLLTCEPNQLKQVFVNIMKNGIEAMPEGGTLTVELAPQASDRLVIRITDQGTGIPEEELPHLGEPFFTKKETGHGLGLMVSQQIIANHKGCLLIRSEVGVGTCVEIQLPLTASPSQTAHPPL
ncbi:ATP-binding protein [Paenibacillus sp. HJGM_3]|uniref:ATP-binding protein n=1 Tax=Paenibacillus sp. HJGM_3 TaxID=3379816 RepID=UPI00385DEEC1